MPRASTTSDVFNAIAEPRRREIMDLLAGGDGLPVGELVQRLGIPQPAVSKHLGVLRSVRLVSVSRRGRSRWYRLDPRPLMTVHAWIRPYERFWDHKIDRIKQRAERKAAEQKLLTRRTDVPGK